MGNGVSVDQGNLPSYGSGDVSDAVDRKQHDWSQLADAPIIKQRSSALWSSHKPYSGALPRGSKSSEFAEVDTCLDAYSDTLLRSTESSKFAEVDNQLESSGFVDDYRSMGTI